MSKPEKTVDEWNVVRFREFGSDRMGEKIQNRKPE